MDKRLIVNAPTQLTYLLPWEMQTGASCKFLPWTPFISYVNLLQRANSLEKTGMLGKIEDRRIREQRMIWLDGITEINGHGFEQTPGDSEGQGSLLHCSSWGHRVEHNLVTKQQQYKVLNFLTRDVWFSYLTVFKKKIVLITWFLCKNLYIPWLFPYFFRTVPQSICEAVFQA